MAQEKNARLRGFLKETASKGDAGAAGKAVDAEFGRDCTIMISDFSSFLALAKEKGIVAALCMIEKAHEIAEPILKALGGEVLRAEPDCLVVIFTKPIDAVMAARAVSRAFEEQNRKQAGGDQLAICLGIGHGRLLVTEDRIYGEQAIITARLGRAREGRFEVKITPEAYEGVKHLESLAFSPADAVMIGGISITPYQLVFT